MHVEPQAEHQWLQRMVGDWTMTMEAVMQPNTPPEKSQGRESVRSLGGVWVICEGELPEGGTGRTVMSLGYDPAKNKFVGTFLGSMMTNLWVYEGELDTAKNVLTLNTEGPSFSGDGTLCPYRDCIEFKGNDLRTLTSSTPGSNGQWQTFMTATYRRTQR